MATARERRKIKFKLQSHFKLFTYFVYISQSLFNLSDSILSDRQFKRCHYESTDPIPIIRTLLSKNSIAIPTFY